MPSSAPAMHSSLSYDKWNDLDDSDDEEPAPGKPIEAKLESRKANSEIDRDNATHKRMVEYHKLHYKNGENKDLVPPSQIDMMARLIAICDRGNEQSNTHRYSEITRFCAQYKETAFQLPFVNGLAELHRCIVDTSKDPRNTKTQESKDTRLIMEALNTLEACRRFENQALLFEMVCQPSMSERAKKVTEHYVKLDFGKRAMLRHLFKSSAEAFAQMEDEQDEEYEALINPSAVRPGSSARVTRKKGGPFEENQPLIIGGIVVGLAFLVALGFFVRYAFAKSAELAESQELAASKAALTASMGATHDEV
jgi:hypothetical protein